VSAVLAAPPAVDVYTASYDLLARFYLAGPSALRRELLPPVDPLLDALGHVDPDWPARVEDLISRHDQPTELERAQSAYLECLVLPVPGRYVPPYASVYLDGGMLRGDSTFKVLRLYETEGLSWERHRPGAGGGNVIVTAPDHVGVEFAFLALTTNRSGRGRVGVERQQRLAAFLRDHSARWLPAFSDALVAVGAGPVLEGWTDWAVDIVQADIRRRAALPDPGS
jgi:TorA maturation chaperone TorD